MLKGRSSGIASAKRTARSRFARLLQTACLLLALGSASWASSLLGETGALFEETLPTGLKIVVVENAAAPTVSVNVFLAAGSLDETPQTSGLAHFYEHMFFRGTPSLSGLEFKKAIEGLGGITNATTSKDMTHYFIALPAEQARRGLELLADALIRAELDPEGIETEREVVLEEYRIGESNPGRMAFDNLYKMAYGEHPYGMSTIGTKERIGAFRRGDFVRWRADQYQPDRTTVVVVGDVRGAETLRLTRDLFASYKPLNPKKRVLAEPPPPPSEPVLKEENGPVRGALVTLGFASPSVHDQPDVYAVDVLTFLLGQGRASMLHRSLVTEQKLAETVGVTYLTPRQQGLIIFSAFGDRQKADEMRAAVLEQIEKVQKGEFTDEEFARAKARLVQTYLLGTESNSGKADTIGYYHALEAPDFWKTYREQVEAVTREQVVEFAEKYLGTSYWGYTLLPTRGGGRR